MKLRKTKIVKTPPDPNRVGHHRIRKSCMSCVRASIVESEPDTVGHRRLSVRCSAKMPEAEKSSMWTYEPILYHNCPKYELSLMFVRRMRENHPICFDCVHFDLHEAKACRLSVERSTLICDIGGSKIKSCMFRETGGK